MGNSHKKAPDQAQRALLAGASGSLRPTVALALVIAMWSVSARSAEPPPRRARPPIWSQDIRALFFDDARQILDGERPDYDALAGREEVARNAAPGRAAPSSGDEVGWSKLVTADTIEVEIKRLAQQVAADVTTPAAFKGGGYQKCRVHFSMLAVLFAVAAEYDGDVRWQDAAPGLRDLFSRAGYNAKTGTDQTFREASQRKQDLADLVRGSRPVTPAAEPPANWYETADRPPLMQRMELAQQERLSKWLASRNEFARHSDDVQHEAQLLAMLAEVIHQEGFDYWDDDAFGDYAAELRSAAGALSQSAVDEDYDAARAALGRATKACSNCHENYRG